MEEYKYDEESVNALVKWAETATFPEQVMLSDAENIFDVKRYVRANLSDIAAHYPDEFYNPAITRLKWKVKIMQSDWVTLHYLFHSFILRILPLYPSTDISVAL